MSVCPSVCLSLCLPACLVHQRCDVHWNVLFHLHAGWGVYMSVSWRCLGPVYGCVCVCVFLSVYLSTCACVCVCLPVYLSTCACVCVCVCVCLKVPEHTVNTRGWPLLEDSVIRHRISIFHVKTCFFLLPANSSSPTSPTARSPTASWSRMYKRSLKHYLIKLDAWSGIRKVNLELLLCLCGTLD